VKSPNFLGNIDEISVRNFPCGPSVVRKQKKQKKICQDRVLTEKEARTRPGGYANHGPGWGLGVAANHNTLRAVDLLLKSIIDVAQGAFCELTHIVEKNEEEQKVDKR